MQNNISELVFILDRSGSMHGLEADTIGGFNSTIEKQKAVGGTCYVTTVLFDDRFERIHDRTELQKIVPMSEKEYSVRGCTALLDALGSTIRHIASIHRYARPEDVPAHTTFVIMTDGMENDSHKYSSDEIKRKIEHEKEKYGWEFLFLAANIDAVETARHYGIAAERAANYSLDDGGSFLAYGAVCDALTDQRMGRPISSSWSESLDSD